MDAKVHPLQKFGCNLCGQIFTADIPAEGEKEKYDATVSGMLAMLKYGRGLRRVNKPLPPWKASRQHQAVAIAKRAFARCQTGARLAPRRKPSAHSLPAIAVLHQRSGQDQLHFVIVHSLSGNLVPCSVGSLMANALETVLSDILGISDCKNSFALRENLVGREFNPVTRQAELGKLPVWRIRLS